MIKVENFKQPFYNAYNLFSVVQICEFGYFAISDLCTLKFKKK